MPKKKSQHWNPPETAPANSAILGVITIKRNGLQYLTAVYIKDGVAFLIDSLKPVDTEHYEFTRWMHMIDAFMLLGGES